MAKIIISRNAQLLREVELSKPRMTIGRHAHNDIVLAHRAVSAEHAAITSDAGDAILEDLGSTNGTFVLGERIARHRLSDRDRIVVAKFQIDYIAAAPAAPALAGLDVINGASSGKRLSLDKPATTLGSPGRLAVVIRREANGYYVSHLGGAATGLVNGEAIAKQPRLLRDGDRLELTGTVMLFSLPPS
jgi:FHA domain